MSYSIYRKQELAIVKSYLKSNVNPNLSISLLEIGAGEGHQSNDLYNSGFSVQAIDLSNSNYVQNRAFPIIDYDGVNIPFGNNKFNVIFSSNVVEHIDNDNLSLLIKEYRRVSVPEAFVVHIVPSSTWRIITILTYFPKKILTLLTSLLRKTKTPLFVSSYKSVSKRNFFLRFFPSTHGVRGNFFTEIFYFSKFYWARKFKKDHIVLAILPSYTFYSGNSLLQFKILLPLRKFISYFLGSSTYIYILRNINHEEN